MFGAAPRADGPRTCEVYTPARPNAERLRARRTATRTMELSSLPSEPGNSWKLTNGKGGMMLKIPAVGKSAKQHRVSTIVAGPARLKWAAGLIGVDVQALPARLVESLGRDEGRGTAGEHAVANFPRSRPPMLRLIDLRSCCSDGSRRCG